jgi:hypothetical protein
MSECSRALAAHMAARCSDACCSQAAPSHCPADPCRADRSPPTPSSWTGALCERLPAPVLHESACALSGRATVRPRRPSRPPRHARLARPTIGEDRVHLEQCAERELQELGRQNCSTSFDNVAEDAGVLGRDDGAQGAAPLSQLTSMKVSKASVRARS